MKRITLLLLVVAIGVGCSDSTGLEPDDLAGTWVATEWTLINPVNSSETLDVMALGGSMSLVLTNEGSFTSTIREPEDELPDVDTGTYEVVGSTLTIAESGQGSPTAFVATRDGDVMTLTSTDEEFDWDDDGTDDPATVRIVLTR